MYLYLYLYTVYIYICMFNMYVFLCVYHYISITNMHMYSHMCLINSMNSASGEIISHQGKLHQGLVVWQKVPWTVKKKGHQLSNEKKMMVSLGD